MENLTGASSIIPFIRQSLITAGELCCRQPPPMIHAGVRYAIAMGASQPTPPTQTRARWPLQRLQLLGLHHSVF